MSTSDWQGPAIGDGVGSTDGEAGPGVAVADVEVSDERTAPADGELAGD
jgi:hypothetical protein